MASNALDPKLVADIEALELTARRIVQGAYAGIHRSPRRGSSIEFSEHKVYSPGDEIRHIDWRVFAKTDRHHIKQFEDETNLTVDVLVDHSGSMGFASGQTSKLDFARKLAAAWAYLALRQHDATGLFAFAGQGHTALPPRSTSAHLVEVLGRLSQLEPAGETHVAQALDAFANQRRRRGVVALFSDLFDAEGDVAAVLRRLTARGYDVVLFHVLDPAEIEFPYELPTLFESMEDPRRLFVHPRVLRPTYVREMQRWLADTERNLNRAGVDYVRAVTNLDPGPLMTQVLGRRARGRVA